MPFTFEDTSVFFEFITWNGIVIEQKTLVLIQNSPKNSKYVYNIRNIHGILFSSPNIRDKALTSGMIWKIISGFVFFKGIQTKES